MGSTSYTMATTIYVFFYCFTVQIS